MARLKEAEAKNVKYLEERQQISTDGMLFLYAIGIGLAHHNLYGPGQDDNIEPFIREWNKQVCRIHREGLSFRDLQKELLEKTGVNFEVRDE